MDNLSMLTDLYEFSMANATAKRLLTNRVCLIFSSGKFRIMAAL